MCSLNRWVLNNNHKNKLNGFQSASFMFINNQRIIYITNFMVKLCLTHMKLILKRKNLFIRKKIVVSKI